MNSTLDGLFRRNLEQFPERVLLRSCDGTILTHEEFARQAATTVEQLMELGIRSGDRVVSYASDTLTGFWFILASANAGVIPVPVPGSYSVQRALHVARLVDAKAVFTTPARATEVAGCGALALCYGEPGTGGSKNVILEQASGSRPLDRVKEVLDAAAAGHGEEDLCIMLLSSGSSGEPKLIQRSHRSMVSFWPNATYGFRAEDEPAERVLMAHPFDVGGCGHYLLVTALGLAAEACIPTATGLGLPLEDTRTLDPTIMILPARSLRALHRQYEDSGDAAAGRPILGPSAKVLRTAGAYVEPHLLELVASQGVDAGELYGMTEAGPVALTPRGGWRPGHVGHLFPDVEVKIAEDGEVLVRSPRLMDGYYKDEERTKEAFTEGGYYRTGDVGELVDGNYLRLLGRKRDVIRPDSAGLVYPAPVETRIEALPWVEQVVVVGDQRPHLSALIVVNAEEAGELGTGSGGYIPVSEAGSLYARAREDVAAINDELEPVMRLRRVALLAIPMGADLYKRVSLDKVRRNRPAIAERYADEIEGLYGEASTGVAI